MFRILYLIDKWDVKYIDWLEERREKLYLRDGWDAKLLDAYEGIWI